MVRSATWTLLSEEFVKYTNEIYKQTLHVLLFFLWTNEKYDTVSPMSYSHIKNHHKNMNIS